MLLTDDLLQRAWSHPHRERRALVAGVCERTDGLVGIQIAEKVVAHDETVYSHPPDARAGSTGTRIEAMKLSVLDLISVSDNQTVREAIEAAMLGAELADQLGYERLWFGEWHNTASVASSATDVLIAAAAARTKRIRLGAGGVMLPNHAPLVVAEHYGTLAQLHPDRIDLGIGRSPGTDPVTARALRRSSQDPDDLMQNVRYIHQWLDSGVVGGIEVGVAKDTRVPLWGLGSSTAGALMAATLGLPFSFASHFAPEMMDFAIPLYRERFNAQAPTAQVSQPYLQVAVNVIACDTQEEAERQWSTTRNLFIDMERTGNRLPLRAPAPVDPKVGELELARVDTRLSLKAVGDPGQVWTKLQEIGERCGADEIITLTYAHDPAVRRRSLELVAEAAGLN